MLDKKSILTILVLIGHILFCGCLYGFASLQLILEREGVMDDGCNSVIDTCTQQSARYNLVYTLGTSTFTIGCVHLLFLNFPSFLLYYMCV